MSNPRRSVSLFCLILGVILILSGQITAQNITVNDWWQNTITYQVWTRSFQDSNGDGIGDLQGVINRLDHFEELGVETIWLNTIYPSPLSNSGFDLSDYENVDSVYGSLEDFDELVAAAHNRGLKVILDFIPNHSSVDHPWFNASVYRVNPYTDYYIWQNGTLNASGNRIPPNNWVRISSDNEEESAWNWNSIRQQWYLHQFTTDEADLNLRNENVIAELLNVLDFWLDRDVDGFYIHGVPYFLEDENFTDNPTGTSDNSFGLDENVNLLYRFREHVDSWALLNDNETKFLVAEGFENDTKLMAYYGNNTNDGVAPVNVHFISEFNSNSNASYIKNRIDSWISAVPSSQTTNWKLSTQDYSRTASRYGLNRADGINMFVLALPGRVFTYYGEEIAMLDNQDISYTDTVDSEACDAGESSYTLISRDPYRTPMQWDSTTNAGFTNSSNAYLPVHVAYSTRNVVSQLASESSNINTYKAVSALRSTPTFVYGSYEIQALNNDRVLVLRRSLDSYPTYILVINLGLGRVTVNLTEVFTDLQDSLNIAVLSSNGVLSGATVNTGDFLLTANAAVLLTDAEDDVTTQPGETIVDDDWWQTAAIYQIYTKSFQDSDGNGVGDLQGIISRLSYLEETGVTGFSLTPFYPSPQIDGGYDISNFTDIDPLFGSFEDFQKLVTTAHKKNLKVILDFVPNHSSDEHIWFQNSVAQIDPYTDYYVWRNGVISDGVIQPPNNWLSVFGGSAWTWNGQRQQYYLHQFHARQPDLNFRSSYLVTEITNVLRFWLDQGVDGFRISAVAHLFENQSFPNEPVNEDADSSVLESDYEYLRHIYTTDLDETINTVYQWRKVVDDYAAQSDRKTRILITDSTANQDVVARYFGNETNQGAHLPLNFGIITNLTRLSLASTYISTFNEWLDLASSQNRTLNWILGNHDYGRIASRFALNRADGLNMLMLLPGTAFTYMGEELALLDTEISFNETQDPHAINAGSDRFDLFTRDPARTPYHWDNSTSGGFSTNVSTWLPINENYLTRNLAAQIAAERSNYQTYKTILELRQTDTIKRGDTHFLALSNDRVLAFIRELEAETTYVVVINLGLSTVNVDLSEFSNLLSRDIQVCLSSSNAITTAGTDVDITSVPLSANAAIVLCNAEILETTTQIITSTTVTSDNTTGSTTEPTTTPISSTTTTNQTTSATPSNSTDSTTESITTPISTTTTTDQTTSATPSNSTDSTTESITTPISTTTTTNQTTSATPSNSTDSTTESITTPISTTTTTNQTTSATPSNSTDSTTESITTPISTTTTTNQTTSATPSNSTDSTTESITTPISTTTTTDQTTSATPSNSTDSTTESITTPISTTTTTNQTTSATPSNSTDSTTEPTPTPISTTTTTNQTTSATPSNSTDSTTESTTTPISTTTTTNQTTSATPSNSTDFTTESITTPISTTTTTNQTTSTTPSNSTDSTTESTTTPISTTTTTNQTTSATPSNSTDSTTESTTTPISTTTTTNQTTSATPSNSTDSTTESITTPISTTTTTNQTTSATPSNSTDSTTESTTTPISTTTTTNQTTSATPSNSTDSTTESITTPISTTTTTNQTTSATPSNSTDSTTESITTPISTTTTTNQTTSATPSNSTDSTTESITTPISTTTTTNQTTSATPSNSTDSTTVSTTTPISTTTTTNQTTSATPSNSTDSTTVSITTPISTTTTTNQTTSATPSNITETTTESITTPVATTVTPSATPSSTTESTTDTTTTTTPEPGPEPDIDASGSDASTAYISSVLVITTLYSITFAISSLRI